MGVAAMIFPVHVMNEDDVDAIEPKTFQTCIERATCAIVGIIVLDVMCWGANKSHRLCRRVGSQPHDLADLGRHDNPIAIDLPQDRSETPLRHATTILRTRRRHCVAFGWRWPMMFPLIRKPYRANWQRERRLADGTSTRALLLF